MDTKMEACNVKIPIHSKVKTFWTMAAAWTLVVKHPKAKLAFRFFRTFADHNL
jgi:hypothetical protein